MKGAILQPTYLPWMGYFEMVDFADIFVVFDHAQFVKKSWQQRNLVKTSGGKTLLTIPVKKKPRNTPISGIEISYNNKNPLERHWKTITHAYQNADYFEGYREVFGQIYSTEHRKLRDLNVKIIKTICHILGIGTKIVLSSELDLKDSSLGKTERVINLCKKAGITYLYDAKGAKEFIDTSLFGKENIQVEFQSYEHPVYSQLFGEFIPYLSVIDLLFNEGERSLAIIRAGRT